jgi:glucokinase
MGAVGDVLADLAASPLWLRAGAVGIGSAGPVDASAGTVSPVNVPGWRGFPLVDRVAAATGGLPVTLVGDGVAMTAAEHWLGAARGYDNALCLVVSTGVGGGLVLGGKLHPGPSGNAGHIGHISVDLDGDPCPCGARGCVERLASGPNIARRALENGWLPGPDGDATAAAVAASARAGDPVAVASFERAAQALAAGIAATATLTDIDIAVIGGGVAGAGEVLFAPLRRSLRDYATLSFVQGLTVTSAVMGTDAGLVGAAAAASAVRPGSVNGVRAVAAQ